MILEKIYLASLKLLEPQSTEEFYATIVREAVQLVGAEYGSIALEQQGTLVKVYSSMPIQIVSRKRGFTYQSFTKQKILVVSIKETGNYHPEIVSIGVRWTAFIPISYQGQSIGVLIINSLKDKRFTRRELRAVKLFGSIVSLTLNKNQLYDEIKKALETRDLFISMAAHELRTPVTTIHGYTQLLMNKAIHSSTESRMVKELNAECIRLVGLIDDLLTINRIKTGKSHFFLKECHLKEIINRAINNFKFNYPDREIIFEDNLFKKSDLIIGDFDKLLQVMTNLLENAAKFSLSNTRIVVQLKFHLRYFILQIQDQGQGISKIDLPHVFEGYYRGSENSIEGMGLGLFLAKNIIAQHHGSIHLHSKVNKGTLVEVQLPKAKI